MHKKLFGTDGIRGTVNQYPMTPEIALKFGMASGIYLKQEGHVNHAVIAKDTRLSGYLIESALTAGLISMGINITLVGPMPTPAVPMLIKSLRADFGIMISASHNPYYDNGLKLFGHNGYKLGDQCENKVQELILEKKLDQFLSAPDKLGKAYRLEDAPGRYIEYVKNSFPKNKTLAGLKIVIDCANGSAYKIAPTIFWELGAEVISIGCSPNGFNINDQCGSTDPSALVREVLKTKADIGIALDGDADRVLICDELGNVVHGDHLIGIIAKNLHDGQNLMNQSIVVTNMSNGALDHFLKDYNIAVFRTQIGDRYVSEGMKNYHSNFGAEQSGHIILGQHSTTGDGIIAALQVLNQLLSSGKKMSQIAQPFKLYPQLTTNLQLNGGILTQPNIQKILDKLQQENQDYKIIVRKSGTENLVRVLVEGQDPMHAAHLKEKIIDILHSAK